MLALVKVRQSSAIHVACALRIWLKTSVCTLSNLTSLLLPHLHSAQMHPHSAGNFSKELAVHPHHSMALLMGLFFPAKMSTKCGGKHSSSVSDSSCSSLLLGTSNTSGRCAASISVSSVVPCGGVTSGADDGLADVVLEAPSCRFWLPDCPSGSVSAV